MEDQDIKVICKLHQLECNKITKIIGSFEKEILLPYTRLFKRI
jgi:hypothetical protein